MGQILNKKYYTYNDLTIMPCVVSEIEHRSQCEPWNKDGMLPLFTAPMDTVVSEDNFMLFEKNHIHAILPRTAPLDTRKFYSTKGRWAAYSLKEFSDVFCNEGDKLSTTHKLKALIDVANGHMKCVFELARKARSIYGDNLVLMGGNIANPKTYEAYAKAGFDYVRCGIGSGCGCISSTCTAIHTPMATLINDIAQLKKEIEDDYRNLPCIIADGGIRDYRDVIKALALGADYVMVGSVFSRMLESAAPKYSVQKGDIAVSDFESYVKYEDGTWSCGDTYLGEIYATFYGMASREGQVALNGAKTKTSEGIKKSLKVDYTMQGWVTNFSDYLRSAMSYVGVKNLDRFRENAKLVVNSENAIMAVNK